MVHVGPAQGCGAGQEQVEASLGWLVINKGQGATPRATRRSLHVATARLLPRKSRAAPNRCVALRIMTTAQARRAHGLAWQPAPASRAAAAGPAHSA